SSVARRSVDAGGADAFQPSRGIGPMADCLVIRDKSQRTRASDVIGARLCSAHCWSHLVQAAVATRASVAASALACSYVAHVSLTPVQLLNRPRLRGLGLGIRVALLAAGLRRPTSTPGRPAQPRCALNRRATCTCVAPERAANSGVLRFS